MSLGYFLTKAFNRLKSLAADGAVDLATLSLMSLGIDKSWYHLLLLEPTDGGQYIPVGKDRMTYEISAGPEVKLINHTHLKTYKYPPE